MICSKCGWKESDEAVFCGRCGHKIQAVKLHPKRTSEEEQDYGNLIVLGGTLIILFALVGALIKMYSPTKDMSLDKKEELNEEYPGTFVCPESHIRELQISDIENLSDADLRLCRNEIYARHGFVFGVKDLREHFENLPWYQKNEKYSINDLSKLEKKNAKLVREYEEERGTSGENYAEGYGDEEYETGASEENYAYTKQSNGSLESIRSVLYVKPSKYGLTNGITQNLANTVIALQDMNYEKELLSFSLNVKSLNQLTDSEYETLTDDERAAWKGLMLVGINLMADRAEFYGQDGVLISKTSLGAWDLRLISIGTQESYSFEAKDRRKVPDSDRVKEIRIYFTIEPPS